MQSSLEYTFKEGKKLAVQAPRNDDILKRTFKTINIELIIILNILCPISTLISSNSSNKGIAVHKDKYFGPHDYEYNNTDSYESISDDEV